MVLAAIRETGATAVKVDSIGVGFGVIGELRNAARRGEHGAAIRAVNVAAASSRPDRYLNLRAELWWEIGRNQSAERAWDLSEMENADATVAQLLEPRWDLDPRGRIRVEKKEDVISRLGRSPDNADALLLAFAHPVAGDAIASAAGVSLSAASGQRVGGLGSVPLGRSGLVR